MNGEQLIEEAKSDAIQIASGRQWKEGDHIRLFSEVYKIHSITESCVTGTLVGERGHFVSHQYNSVIYTLDLRHPEWLKLS